MPVIGHLRMRDRLSKLQISSSSYKVPSATCAQSRSEHSPFCSKSLNSATKLGYNKSFDRYWPPFCTSLLTEVWNTVLTETNSGRPDERRTIVDQTWSKFDNNYRSTATKRSRNFFCGNRSFLTLLIIRKLDRLGQACERMFHMAFFLDLRKRFMPSREWMLAVGNRKEGSGSHSQAGSV